jgi:hypothetical protein
MKKRYTADTCGENKLNSHALELIVDFIQLKMRSRQIQRIGAGKRRNGPRKRPRSIVVQCYFDLKT